MPSAVELVLAELSRNPTDATTVGIELRRRFFGKRAYRYLEKRYYVHGENSFAAC